MVSPVGSVLVSSPVVGYSSVVGYSAVGSAGVSVFSVFLAGASPFSVV